MFEAFAVSTGVVALGEIGDKTQLLAIVLAAKFRRPVPIILGILAATILNHAAAATLGYLVAQWLTGPTFQEKASPGRMLATRVRKRLARDVGRMTAKEPESPKPWSLFE